MSTDTKLECSECKKKFKSKSGMITHIKTCKDKKFYCIFCKTNFSSNRNLNNHKIYCNEKVMNEVVEKYEKQINDLIEKYEKQINQIKTEFDLEIKVKNEQIKFLKEIKPTITNNNSNYYSNQTSTKINNNVCNISKPPLTREFLKELGSTINFVDNIFADEEDICRWTLKQGLNNYILILDKSRKVLSFTDEKGNTVRDQDGMVLANLIYSEIGKNIEKVEEYLDGLEDDPNEIIMPTTLMKRKKVVNNIKTGNEYSIERLGKSIFRQYPKYENQLLDKSSSNVLTIKHKMEKVDLTKFNVLKGLIKNKFYEYNFDPMVYGIHTIGGFLRQLFEDYGIEKESEDEKSDSYDYIKLKDDMSIFQKLDQKTLFDLLTNIFNEEDIQQMFDFCKNGTFAKNIILFQRIFINKEQVENIEKLKEEIFNGLTGYKY